MDIETPFFLLVLERKSPKLKDHFTPVSITHPPEKCFPQMLAKYRSTTKWKLIFHDWMHLAGWAYLRRDFECHRTRRWLEKLTNPSLLAPKYTCLSKIDSNTPVVRLSSTHWEGQTAVAQLCCTLLNASPPLLPPENSNRKLMARPAATGSGFCLHSRFELDFDQGAETTFKLKWLDETRNGSTLIWFFERKCTSGARHIDEALSDEWQSTSGGKNCKQNHEIF